MHKLKTRPGLHVFEDGYKRLGRCYNDYFYKAVAIRIFTEEDIKWLLETYSGNCGNRIIEQTKKVDENLYVLRFAATVDSSD